MSLLQGFGLEYDRYLREVVMALEEDEAFRKKLEETNMTDIKVSIYQTYLKGLIGAKFHAVLSLCMIYTLQSDLS